MVVRVFGATAAALVVAGIDPSSACASSPPPPPAPVTFRAPGGGSMRVVGPGLPEGKYCGEGCTLYLAPENYTVFYSFDGKTTPLAVVLGGNSEVRVSPPSQAQRELGLALLVGGGAVATAGAIALYLDVMFRTEANDIRRADPAYPRYHTPPWVTTVMISGAVGLGVATVGTILFFSARPSAEVIPRGTEAARRFRSIAERPRFTLLPALGPRGGGLDATWTF